MSKDYENLLDKLTTEELRKQFETRLGRDGELAEKVLQRRFAEEDAKLQQALLQTMTLDGLVASCSIPPPAQPFINEIVRRARFAMPQQPRDLFLANIKRTVNAIEQQWMAVPAGALGVYSMPHAHGYCVSSADDMADFDLAHNLTAQEANCVITAPTAIRSLITCVRALLEKLDE